MALSKQDQQIRDMLEKETPKNIVVSFVLAISFGVAAGLAAIAFREMCQHLTNKVIAMMLDAELLSAAQPGGIRNLSSIIFLAVMLLGWVISFMVVWHKIEKAPSMQKRVKYGVTAIVVALALFGIFELVGYSIIGSWLYLTGAIF
ncbi:MAG: hypothetical protein IJC56_11245 [Clostridia bacterium]|nr:hypothetical protein [Clostridia bacterium]